MLTLEEQAAFVEEAPEIFLPISGGWGRMGHTHIRLAAASEEVLTGCMADAVPADVAAKVKNYLFSILEGFPDELFQVDKTANLDVPTPVEGAAQQPERIRSSQSEFALLPFCRVEKENLANDLAALGLLLHRKSRDRHPPFKISCWPMIPARSLVKSPSISRLTKSDTTNRKDSS
jgi:hypothetical protein